VSYQFDNQILSVSVADPGPGIPVEQHERVFDRFYRDIDAEGDGSGLGLAIARQIASLHGAEITLALTKSGQGLSVKVSFKQNEKI
jgi:signal transduction histidine kinase